MQSQGSLGTAENLWRILAGIQIMSIGYLKKVLPSSLIT